MPMCVVPAGRVLFTYSPGIVAGFDQALMAAEITAIAYETVEAKGS